MQNQYLHSNTGDGTRPQTIFGGTRPKVGGAHDIFFLSDLFFVTVGFVYSRWRSTVTDGWWRQIHFTRHFSHAQCTCLMMYNYTTWLKTSKGSSVCTSASCHPHVIHDERLIVSRRFSVPRFVPFRVSLLHLALLFPLQIVLCPELLLPCGQRRGKHTLRLRQSRSLALWPHNNSTQQQQQHSVAILAQVRG